MKVKTSAPTKRRAKTIKNSRKQGVKSSSKLVTAASVTRDGKPTEEDQLLELSLRPKRLAEYIGQRHVKDNLRIFMKAALNRREALDHVLLTGPPGLGKTTLANIIAKEMDAYLHSTAGPAIEIAGDLVAQMTNLEAGDVLFIDEIHRLNPAIEEKLYPAMEDYEFDLMIGQGAAARSHKYKLEKFTLVGATTRPGLLTAPLRGRFGIAFHLDFYPPEDLEIICKRSAEILNVEIEDAGAREIAQRSRGTPRIVNRLLRRVRDYAAVDYDGRITHDVAKDSLDRMKVDTYGLDEMDQKLIRTIIENFKGGPVGLGTISASIHEERDSIEEIIEPYLIQKGLLIRTPRGRIATPLAYEHFKSKLSDPQNFPLKPSLFDSQ